MKLTRKALWGIGIAWTLLMATPASAAWKILDLDNYYPSAGVATYADNGAPEEYQYEIGIDPAPIDLPNSGSDEISLQAPSLADLQLGELNDVGTQNTQVPEPSSLALIALGLGGLGWRLRRGLKG